MQIYMNIGNKGRLNSTALAAVTYSASIVCKVYIPVSITRSIQMICCNPDVNT